MPETVEIIIRTFVAFLWLWIFTQMIGKQIIAQSTYHLFVLSALVGTIAGNMAFNIKIKFLYFLLSLFIISGIGYFLTLISLKNKKARKWISGEPTIIIKDGNLLEQNMKKSKYMWDSLQQGLRSKDIFDLKEVEYAILETNGSLSVLKKPDYRNAAKQDLSVLDPNQMLPVELIRDRQILEQNLNRRQLTKEWLSNELSKRQLTSNDVFYAVMATNGQLFFQLYKDSDRS